MSREPADTPIRAHHARPPHGWRQVALHDFPLAAAVAAVEHLDRLVSAASQLADPSTRAAEVATPTVQIAVRVPASPPRSVSPLSAHQLLSRVAGYDAGVVRLLVSPEIVQTAQRFSALLDALDTYCAELELTPPSEPAVRFRRWALREVLRQSAGQKPTPYPSS